MVLLAAGKAAVPMARAALGVLGRRIVRGLVVSKEGHGSLPEGIHKRIAHLEAAHPEPDARGLAAARAAVRLAAGCRKEEVLLVLLSGGASALLPLPVAGVTLAQKRWTTRLLLRCGAPIHELNSVRKHLSVIKGGGLARLAGAGTIVTLAVSDVRGNDLATIGSGLTAPDPTTFAQALLVLRRRGIDRWVPAPVRDALKRGAAGLAPETLKSGGGCLASVYHVVLADLAIALRAASREALARGYAIRVARRPIDGEARMEGRRLGQTFRRWSRGARQAGEGGRPLALIAGGEPTVKVRGPGRGGRAMELVLAAAQVLEGDPGAAAAGIGTDGTDGPTLAAGAVACGRTLARARSLGLDPGDCLDRNDTLRFFQRAGGLIVTGPTGTNVGDVYVMLDRSAPRRARALRAHRHPAGAARRGETPVSARGRARTCGRDR